MTSRRVYKGWLRTSTLYNGSLFHTENRSFKYINTSVNNLITYETKQGNKPLSYRRINLITTISITDKHISNSRLGPKTSSTWRKTNGFSSDVNVAEWWSSSESLLTYCGLDPSSFGERVSTACDICRFLSAPFTFFFYLLLLLFLCVSWFETVLLVWPGWWLV